MMFVPYPVRVSIIRHGVPVATLKFSAVRDRKTAAALLWNARPQ
jgi:hypothetical protein